jgi:very-short-patch-repair endonuclease
MLNQNSSTPSRTQSSHPSRGELWNPKSLYSYWEIPKNKLLTDRAKELRKAGNLSEVLFWQTFKDKRKFGFDVDRQVIIGNYIVDFFIPELGLVFEIDGSSHDDKMEYDAERDAFMKDLNLQVVRIFDIDVKKNMGNVYNFVSETIHKRKEVLKFPSMHPPRPKGHPSRGE